jgi:molybdate transport system substrate-binding protein
MWGRSSTRISAVLLAGILALACTKKSGGEAGAGKGSGGGGGNGAKHDLMLGVAASLRGVMPTLVDAFQKKEGAGGKIEATYGSSGDLKKQVTEGAPIDAVILASGKPIDELALSGKIDGSSRVVIATNTLVLVGSQDSKDAGLKFATIEEIAPGERLAIGDPASVPAGEYAREGLQKLGKWDDVRARIVLGGDVSQVLNYARKGEVPAAIVYKTDLHGVNDVVLLDEAKGDWAPRPEVVAAVVSESGASARAKAFLDFVKSADGQKILADYGFGPP